jgi:hypothetical protein
MQFINEIKYYNPAVSYHLGKLQVVPDGLLRRFGNCKEGEPADTDRFIEVEEVAEGVNNVKEEEKAILMLKA